MHGLCVYRTSLDIRQAGLSARVCPQQITAIKLQSKEQALLAVAVAPHDALYCIETLSHVGVIQTPLVFMHLRKSFSLIRVLVLQ